MRNSRRRQRIYSRRHGAITTAAPVEPEKLLTDFLRRRTTYWPSVIRKALW